MLMNVQNLRFRLWMAFLALGVVGMTSAHKRRRIGEDGMGNAMG